MSLRTQLAVCLLPVAGVWLAGLLAEWAGRMRARIGATRFGDDLYP